MIVKNKIIFVDFDKTITDNTPYPNTGQLRKGCKYVLDMLYANGNTIVVNTLRKGKDLREAKKLCKEWKLPIHSFNYSNNKMRADIYIDDKNIFIEDINWYDIFKYLGGK